MDKQGSSFTITKRISKHGGQSIITIPKLLENELQPGTIAEVRITILKKAGKDASEHTELSRSPMEAIL